MKKILVTATAAFVTAIAFAASPAAAGNFNLSIGVGGWGPGYGYWGPAYGGVYVAPAPVVVAPQNNWAAHVNWCHAKHASYNPNTNTYLTSKGFWKVCNSPYI